MHFDFYDQYKTYLNVELLQIVQHPEAYQPAAVEAAERVLKEREITAEDMEATAQLYADKQQRKEKIESYQERATDLLEPIFRPGTEVPLVKWLNILLVVLAIEYLRKLYNFARIFLLSSDDCVLCGLEALSWLLILFELLFIPVNFYLLLKRKPWGWILLFAYYCMMLTNWLLSLPLYLKFISGRNVNISFIITILVSLAIVVYLWRKEVQDFFQVSTNTKLWTLGVSVALSIISITFSYMQG